jgi:hypothetical protein
LEQLEERRMLNASSAIISNGTVQLGINAQGDLNAPGGTVDSNVGTTLVGLRYVRTNSDAVSPGTPAEGWGVSAVSPQGTITGYANVGIDGVVNLTTVSFTSTADSAISVVRVGNAETGTPILVTHDFHPVPGTPDLYEVTVTITNLTSQTLRDLRYRRDVDWDVTVFDEYVTNNLGTTSPVVMGDRPAILGDSNNGFASSNPLAPATIPGFLDQTGNFDTFGPLDQGTLFDIGFGSLAGHASRTFHLYYGAAGSKSNALHDLQAVGAEAYSIAQPTTAEGKQFGTPNTFILGFSGLGGEPITQQSDRTFVPPGGTGTVQALSTSGVTATLTGGNGVLLVAATIETPLVKPLAPLIAVTDLQTFGDTTGATLDAKFYYPTTVTPQDAARLSLQWFDVKAHAFEEIVGVGKDGKPAAPHLVIGPVTVDGKTFGGFFEVTLDSTTTPSLPLVGTIFAITLSNVVTTTVVVSPPTASTTSTPTGTTIEFTSATQLSLALTAAPTSRTSAGGISPGANTAEAVTATIPPPTNSSTSAATTTTAATVTSTVGGSPDDTTRRGSRRLTDQELLDMWIQFEQTGELPPLPNAPVPPPKESKPPTPPPAPDQGQSSQEPIPPPEKVSSDAPPALPEFVAPVPLAPASSVDEQATRLNLPSAMVALLAVRPWNAWPGRKRRTKQPELTRQRLQQRGRGLGPMELPAR